MLEKFGYLQMLNNWYTVRVFTPAVINQFNPLFRSLINYFWLIIRYHIICPDCLPVKVELSF